MAKLARIKTTQTAASVEDFIHAISDEEKRKDSLALVKMMQKATGEKPRMWGSALVGFGNMIYTSPRTGRQVEWFKIGFSPRKSNLSIHLTGDISKQGADLEKLGKHKTGVGCLYINKLADVDQRILEKMINHAAKKKM